MSALVSRLRKRYQTTLETFVTRFEHVSAQLIVEQTRFHDVQLQLPPHLPSRSGSEDRRGHRCELDPATEHNLSVIEDLLASIQAIHRKYALPNDEPRPEGRSCRRRIEPSRTSTSKHLSPSPSISPSPPPPFPSRVEQYRERLSPKDLVAWVVSDARELEEKIARLGELLDDVEDLVRAVKDSRRVVKLSNSEPKATLIPLSPSAQLATADAAMTPGSSSPPPPPYSAVDPQLDDRHALPHPYPPPPPPPPPPLLPPSHPPHLLHHPPSPTGIDTLQPTHYLALKSHLITSLLHRTHPAPNALIASSLSLISPLQLRDLRTDVHDELVRRRIVTFGYSPSSASSNSLSTPSSASTSHTYSHQNSHSSTLTRTLPTSLPTCTCLPPSRRKARHVISLLPPQAFGDLVSDLVLEHERRFPALKRLRSVVPLVDSSGAGWVERREEGVVPGSMERRGCGRGGGERGRREGERGRCACAMREMEREARARGEREMETEREAEMRRRSREGAAERIVIETHDSRDDEDPSPRQREQTEQQRKETLSTLTSSRWSCERGTWDVDIPAWMSGTTTPHARVSLALS